MTSRKSSGWLFITRQVMARCTRSCLLPVVPAMSRCGMRPDRHSPPCRSHRDPAQSPAATSRQSCGSSFHERAQVNHAHVLVRTSMPTSPRPGIGASMRMDEAASARAKSLCSVVRADAHLLRLLGPHDVSFGAAAGGQARSASPNSMMNRSSTSFKPSASAMPAGKSSSVKRSVSWSEPAKSSSANSRSLQPVRAGDRSPGRL